MEELAEVVLPSLDGDELSAQTLYFKNIGVIQNAILTTNPDLFIADGENIVEKLEDRLHEYDGPEDDEEFITWAVEATKADVARYKLFYGVIRESRRAVRSAIWSLLKDNLDLIDHTSTSFVIDQIEESTLVWAWNHLDDLASPGDAKASTRLAAQAKWQAMTWRKSRLRFNERFDDAPIEGFGDTVQVNVDSSGEITVSRPVSFDPRHDADDDEDEQPVSRPRRGKPIPAPSDALVAMKSGAPKLLCPVGCGLQPISAETPKSKKKVVLRCGHTRPALLPASG